MIVKRALGWFYEHVMWRPTAGRPWTYEIRAWCDRHVILALGIAIPTAAGFVMAQFLSVYLLSWWGLPVIVAVDFVGYLAGHLWWDTRGEYIKPHSRFRQ